MTLTTDLAQGLQLSHKLPGAGLEHAWFHQVVVNYTEEVDADGRHIRDIDLAVAISVCMTEGLPVTVRAAPAEADAYLAQIGDRHDAISVIVAAVAVAPLQPDV